MRRAFCVTYGVSMVFGKEPDMAFAEAITDYEHHAKLVYKRLKQSSEKIKSGLNRGR
jgi:hypothetical protein